MDKKRGTSKKAVSRRVFFDIRIKKKSFIMKGKTVMKFSCPKSQLLEVINTVQKAVSAKSIMPILECIKIEANPDGTVVITGNNLEICIEYKSNFNVTDGGSIALSSKIFGEIIRRLPDDEVFVNINEENNIATITCQKAEFNIQGLSPDEYPAVPEVNETYKFSISQQLLKKMLRRTIFSASVNDMKRPIITGVLFSIDTGVLTMAATDGHRLALVKEVADVGLEEKKFVVPGASLREISKVLKDTDEKVEIIVSQRYAMFDFGEYKIVTRLLEGEFVNFGNILAAPNTIFVTIDTRSFCESLERASLLINDDISTKVEKIPVRLNIGYDKIEITCITGRGKVHDIVDADIKGDDIEIGFNHKYLLEALRACEEEKVQLEFSHPRSPCFIRSAENDGSYTFMISPIRLYD